MDRELIARATELARRGARLLVATAGKDRTPHLATASEIEPAPDGRLMVRAWFCSETVENLASSPKVLLVVWKPSPSGTQGAMGDGFQLVGEVEEMVESSMLDGYAPGLDDALPIPQVQRQLRVRVERVLGFADAPHVDTAL